jgi:hypothetical protein
MNVLEPIEGVRWHHLKTWPEFFRQILRGDKVCEVRNNDRNFLIGHCLVLNEYNPEEKSYTGRSVSRRITCVTTAGCVDGYVALSLEKI